MIYVAYIPDLSVPIAVGETHTQCFVEALKVLDENKDDAIIGQTARMILDSTIHSTDSALLTISPFVPA